jgi:hypothetical protein
MKIIVRGLPHKFSIVIDEWQSKTIVRIYFFKFNDKRTK